MTMESSNIGSSWLHVVRERIRERNVRECDPFKRIYTSNKHLWEKCTYLDSLRVSTKHNLALLEHESSDIAAKGDIEHAFRHCSKKLTAVYTELKPFNFDKGKIEQNLIKTIIDQRKLMNNQEEEIKMAKVHMSEAFNTIAKREEERLLQEKLVHDMEEELRFLRNAVAEKDRAIAVLKTENTDLTGRIITEKNKSAKEFDEMNKLLSRNNTN